MSWWHALEEALRRRHRLPLPVEKSGKLGWALAASDDWEDLRVLDNGGGSGAHLQLWEGAGAKVVCLDPDPVGVIAQNFVAGSALQLPFRCGVFHIVLFLDVLEHLPPGSELATLLEIRRVLAPGGQLILTTPNAALLARWTDPAWPFGHRHYSQESVIALLQAAEPQVAEVTTRGAFFTTLSILLMYLFKWFFGRPIPLPMRTWLNQSVDREWRTTGFHTVTAVAHKPETPF